jgi:NAD(P)-dependent dehydrogenase (short-subunit alcohol dehydrogenase family)
MNGDGAISLEGTVALVTGASRGLGRAMALAFVEAGARVGVLASRDSPQLAETMARITSAGGGARSVALVGDVRREADCARIVAEAEARLGPAQVLINNAGIAMNGPGKPFWQIEPDAWRTMVDVNVDGPFLMARAVVPGMIARGFGRIVNVSTSDKTMIRPTYTPYGPSKAFLDTASRVWAAELAGTGVTVNVLAPGGLVDTLADLTGVPTPGRTGLPASVMCGPALWLASRLSDGHTGQRFLGNRWNDALPLAERIAAARDDGAEAPRIM